jgi:hypothetical protein
VGLFYQENPLLFIRWFIAPEEHFYPMKTKILSIIKEEKTPGGVFS